MATGSMVVREFDPAVLVRNPAIMARVGEPDSEKVQMFAESFVQRRDSGLHHQIQPGVVRVTEAKGKEIVELIVGNHRATGMDALNRTLGKKDDPYLFSAVVVPANDEQALETAVVENECKVNSTVFDRAEAMNKLLDLGVKQVRIAALFNVSEASVSQTLAAGKLDKKTKAMVLNGDLETDAAILAANLPVDDNKRAQILEEAIRHRTRYDEIEASVSARKAKEEAAKEVEAAKSKVGEVKAKAKDLKSKMDEQAKAVAELEKLTAKTKDVKEIDGLRKKIEESRTSLKIQEGEHKKLVKEQEKAEKLVEKAKAAKETVATPPKKKTTQEDVKTAAANAGVEGQKRAKWTAKDLVLFIEAWGHDKQDPMPTSVSRLVGKIEARIDGEISDNELKKSFKVNCLKD